LHLAGAPLDVAWHRAQRSEECREAVTLGSTQRWGTVDDLADVLFERKFGEFGLTGFDQVSAIGMVAGVGGVTTACGMAAFGDGRRVHGALQA
jgi:hypothetical protein